MWGGGHGLGGEGWGGVSGVVRVVDVERWLGAVMERFGGVRDGDLFCGVIVQSMGE